MLVGICEINRRQYCAGVWRDIDVAVENLRGLYAVSEVTEAVDGRGCD